MCGEPGTAVQGNVLPRSAEAGLIGPARTPTFHLQLAGGSNMRRSYCLSRSVLPMALGFTLVGPTARAQVKDSLRELRIEVSLSARRLWVLAGELDTSYTAPVAVGSGRKLTTQDRTWKFQTPLGTTKVVARETNPVWVPPEWHYVELARARGLRLERLNPNDLVVLSRNRSIVVNGVVVGLMEEDSVFQPLPPDEEIVFDGTLFIPPFGSAQRRVVGVLGPYRLLLANGVGLHGTPDQASIGKAVTHGCIRLRDDDVTWLYENVPIGTKVEILP